MKYAFVRFVEDHGAEHGGRITCVSLARGEAAESPKEFIAWHNAGCKVEVIYWFEVPEDWKNAVSDGSMNDAFEALLGLDALSDTPLVSDLLATLFEASFRAGREYAKSVMTRCGNFHASTMTELARESASEK